MPASSAALAKARRSSNRVASGRFPCSTWSKSPIFIRSSAGGVGRSVDFRLGNLPLAGQEIEIAASDDRSAAPVGSIITELAQPRTVAERAQIVDAEPAVAAEIFGTLAIHCDDPGGALRLFQ